MQIDRHYHSKERGRRVDGIDVPSLQTTALIVALIGDGDNFRISPRNCEVRFGKPEFSFLNPFFFVFAFFPIHIFYVSATC